MTVADALHRAAEAIRSLPDRDLLELALRAEGPAAPPLEPAVVSAPPTAALRQEVATSATRPTVRQVAANKLPDAESRILAALARRPMPLGEIAQATGLSRSSTFRYVSSLVAAGTVKGPTVRGGPYSL